MRRILPDDRVIFTGRPESSVNRPVNAAFMV